LNDQASLQAMCAAADLEADDVVLEIGPGPGSLTKLLVQKARQVWAVELDDKLAKELPTRVKADNLRVIHEDILRFNFTEVPSGYKVVANIPYYLTSNLIRALSESSNPPCLAALLVQKEVAERLAASPGDMSVLGVTAQFYWHVELGCIVPAESFTPAPKVDSQIVILKRRQQPLFADVDAKQYFRLVRAGFSQKRKTLMNALSGGLSIKKIEAKTMLETAKITPNLRAQTLTLEDWHRLYQIQKPQVHSS